MRAFFPPLSAALCNHLSSLSLSVSLTLWHSLSTSSVLIGPHPLTQDSLSFSSGIISCNVLNLESPRKTISLSSSLSPSPVFTFFHVAEIANCSWFARPGLTNHLMETNSPVPGSDVTTVFRECFMEGRLLRNQILTLPCSENWIQIRMPQHWSEHF